MPVGWAVAMMKAPGAGGVLVSRAAFLAKKLYFKQGNMCLEFGLAVT